jgi:hypothetical protein
MGEIKYAIEITMTISSKIQSKEGIYHIKWESNLVKEIQCATFKFFTLDMGTAMNRVNYLVEIHPRDYFSDIQIKNGI